MNGLYKIRRQHFERKIIGATLGITLIFAGGCRQWRNPAPEFENIGNHPSAAATADVQFALAQSLEQQGNTARAIEAYQKLADKGLPSAFHRLGVLHDKQENFSASEECYQAAIKQMPGNAELWCDLGYSYYLQKKWQAGEAHLRKAIQIDPQLERGHNNLGLLLAASGKSEEALAAFRKAARNEEVALANYHYVVGDQTVKSAEFAAPDLEVHPVVQAGGQPVKLGSSIDSNPIDAALGIAEAPAIGFVVPEIDQSELAVQFKEYFQGAELIDENDAADQGQ